MQINGIPTNPGDLRTQITLQTRGVSSTSGGFPSPTYTTLATVWAKWVNVHGTEIWASQIVEAIAPATVLIRYRNDVDNTCIVLKDGKVYEILAIDDVHNMHEYLELKCQYVRSG
jgi:SPP1 family predicted phage head-tail adaptor